MKSQKYTSELLSFTSNTIVHPIIEPSERTGRKYNTNNNSNQNSLFWREYKIDQFHSERMLPYYHEALREIKRYLHEAG